MLVPLQAFTKYQNQKQHSLYLRNKPDNNSLIEKILSNVPDSTSNNNSKLIAVKNL